MMISNTCIQSPVYPTLCVRVITLCARSHPTQVRRPAHSLVKIVREGVVMQSTAVQRIPVYQVCNNLVTIMISLTPQYHVG